MTNGNHVRVDPIQVGPVVLKPSSSVTCLGVIWSNSLSPKESIAYNISKARRSFFASGISKRKLNPLCSKEVFEVCSLPICLYGCCDVWTYNYCMPVLYSLMHGVLYACIVCIDAWCIVYP